MKFFDELKWRGLVKDCAGSDLESKINDEKITFYWGTDPTADSLHLGHYSSLLTAMRLAKHGHNPILLCGGATGLIGDPRPTEEREILTKEELNHNLESIKKQVTNIFKGLDVEVVNNYDWFKGYEFTEVLRDVGKYINVNYMLDKDIIKRRLSTGITFAEFAYTLIQGYDFLHLYEKKNCIMQVEGSDQWGNITTGLELIRKKLNKEAYAFTMPLVLDNNGVKFGKSLGNALWLDINKTSTYEMYQYLINSDDSKVIDYVKIFTFLSVDEILELEKEHLEKPELRKAQKVLAESIIVGLHGQEKYNEAVKISETLFNGNFKELTDEELEIAIKGMNIHELKDAKSIVDVLTEFNICSSKREAREFINNSSITINGDKVTSLDLEINKELTLNNKYVIIRRGKKRYYIITFN